MILSHIIDIAVQIFVKRSSIYRYILKEVMWSSFELYVILSIRYYHRMIYILLSIMSEIFWDDCDRFVWYKRVFYGYDGHQCPIWVNSQVLFWRSPSSSHQNKTKTHGSPMSWHVLVATFDLSAAHTTTVHIFPVTCWRPHLICQQHTHTYAHTHMYIMQDYRRNIHAKLVFKETSRFKEPDALKNTCDT